jgi:hypothetical protein
MPTRKSVQHIWLDRGSGLVAPEGTISDLSHSSSQTYLQIKEKALALEQLFADSNVPLPPTCDLARLIAAAKTLSDLWLMNKVDELSMTLLFHGVHLDRIAEAVLPLQHVSNRNKYLLALTSGSLDLFERQQSKAKDVLWELEVWSILRGRSLDAVLCEPPDIVVVFEVAKIGIACKKLYSEKNVEKVLSEGVAQIETSFDFGIVAVNLDDLAPSGQILRASNQGAMSKSISDLNARFLRSHERHFRKYLASGRLLSALVSTSVLADVYKRRPRFNNARQSTIWAIPGLPPEKDRQLKRFYDQLMG